MKKITLLFTIIFIYTTTLSQSCLSEGIAFGTQAQIDNFQTDFPGCTEIEGYVKFQGNNITDLGGLNVLTVIGGYLEFQNTYSLTSLSGLDNVTSIGGYLFITEFPDLTSLTGLDNVTSIGGEVRIVDNTALSNLMGLNNVTSIGGRLGILQNADLTTLAGLDNLTSIGGTLAIEHNAALPNLIGLDNLISIGGDFRIAFNELLPNLTGLNNVTSVGEDIYIGYNSSMTSLAGLENLTSMGGGSLGISGNVALTSIAGIENIEPGSIIGLTISGNTSLSICEIQCICDYLATEPDDEIDFGGNAIGCNSETEVEEACEALGISDTHTESFTIYPNPATNELFISSDKGIIINEVNIYNQLGQNVLHQNKVDNAIDVSMLQPGVYIIEVILNDSKSRMKLMMQ